MKCNNCGQILHEDSNFCSYCGCKVEKFNPFKGEKEFEEFIKTFDAEFGEGAARAMLQAHEQMIEAKLRGEGTIKQPAKPPEEEQAEARRRFEAWLAYNARQEQQRTSRPPQPHTSPDVGSHPHTPTSAPTYVQKSTQPTSTKKSKSRIKPLLFLGAIIIAAVIIGVLANNSTSKSAPVTKPQSGTTTVNPPKKDDSWPKLTPVTEPKSGAILYGYEDFEGSEITVSASSSNSCVVKLKTRTGSTRLSFYVRAGDTVTVGVPDEYLYVYFASGDTWYGKDLLFGEDTSYSMDDEICDFTEYNWEYTLYPVSSGNFTQTPIDADEF